MKYSFSEKALNYKGLWKTIAIRAVSCLSCRRRYFQVKNKRMNQSYGQKGCSTNIYVCTYVNKDIYRYSFITMTAGSK